MAESLKRLPLEPEPGPTDILLGHGLMAGLASGALFAAAEMIVARLGGASWFFPWRLFASVLLGEVALAAEMTLGIFLVGFFVHFVLAAVYGMTVAAVGQLFPLRIRANWAAHALVGAVLGIAIWAINFQVIARVAYPWFLEVDPFVQILLHALLFGAPVGLYLTAVVRREERLRYARNRSRVARARGAH